MDHEAIHIICSRCRSRYELNRAEIDALHFSVMACRTCASNIKIIICPECRFSYSLTYLNVPESQYSMTCKKCSHEFRVVFPVIHNPVKKEKAPAAWNTDGEKTDADFSVPDGQRHGRTLKEKISRQRGKMFNADAMHQKTDDEPVALPPLLRGTFSFHRIVYGISGVLSMGLLYLLLTGTTPSPMNGSAFYSLFRIAIMLLMLTVYAVSAAVMIRRGLNRKEPRGGVTLRSEGRFALNTAGPVLVSGMVISGVLSGTLFLFTMAPAVRPLSFAVFYFPLYILAVLMIFLLFSLFWFYPSFIAASGYGTGKGFSRFISFLGANYHMVLITLLPMTMLGVLMLAALQVFQGGVWSVLSMLAGRSFVIHSPGVLSNPFSFFNIFTTHGIDPSGGVSSFYYVAVLFWELIFFLMSLVLASAALSCLVTMSMIIYLFIAGKTRETDAFILKGTGFMVTVLFVLFMFKKIYF